MTARATAIAEGRFGVATQTTQMISSAAKKAAETTFGAQ
jgi:hypothetical protein